MTLKKLCLSSWGESEGIRFGTRMARKKEIQAKRKSVFRNTLVEYTYAANRKQKKDMEMFLLQQSDLIEKSLEKFVKKHTNIKFDIYAQTELGKFQTGEKSEEIIHTKPWFKSSTEKVMNKYEINQKLRTATEKVLDSYDNFMRKESGWFLIKVLQMKMKIYSYKPLRGGCFAVKLPEPYNRMRGILTFPQTGDKRCFLYCVLAGLFPQKQRKNNFLEYLKFETRINTTSLSYPVRIDNMERFERQNDLSINVYILVKKGSDHVGKCIRISDNCSANTHVDLLLHTGHYHLITNLSAFLRYKKRNKRWQCPKWLKFRTIANKNHLCGNQTVLCFPNRNKKQHFMNVQNITFPIYCDLETYNTPVTEGKGPTKTQKK